MSHEWTEPKPQRQAALCPKCRYAGQVRSWDASYCSVGHQVVFIRRTPDRGRQMQRHNVGVCEPEALHTSLDVEKDTEIVPFRHTCPHCLWAGWTSVSGERANLYYCAFEEAIVIRFGDGSRQEIALHLEA